MKVQVVWFNEPSSIEIGGVVSAAVGVALRSEDNVYPVDRPSFALSFECKTLSDLTFLPHDVGLYISGAELARNIVSELIRLYNVRPEVLVMGVGAIEHASKCEHRVDMLEKAAKLAAEELKATRSWLKDHRLASIRRILESALGESSTLFH